MSQQTIIVQPRSRSLPALVGLVVLVGLEILRRKFHEVVTPINAQGMDLDPDLLYEVCEYCPDGGGCTVCWDAGVVPHGCDE